MSEDAWKEDGACRDLDPALMFPHRGGGAAQAKAVCATCPVTTQCLDYALTNREKYGVWGGKSERERQKLRRGTRRETKHGTRSRYTGGCRCEDCRTANNSYQAARLTPVQHLGRHGESKWTA